MKAMVNRQSAMGKSAGVRELRRAVTLQHAADHARAHRVGYCPICLRVVVRWMGTEYERPPCVFCAVPDDVSCPPTTGAPATDRTGLCPFCLKNEVDWNAGSKYALPACDDCGGMVPASTDRSYFDHPGVRGGDGYPRGGIFRRRVAQVAAGVILAAGVIGLYLIVALALAKG